MNVGSLTEIDWSIVPVSVVEDSLVDEVVLAAGFPVREPDGMEPVVRLGEILAVDRSAVKTSCTLTSGDSGGPLMNSLGELIGLHRQIGAGAESNGHVALSAISEALGKTEHWKALTQHHGGRLGAKFFSNQLMASPLVAAAAKASR